MKPNRVIKIITQFKDEKINWNPVDRILFEFAKLGAFISVISSIGLILWCVMNWS